ncbi:hypothetical protein C9374_002680 [Naegleria lovaniensis]|uniref:Uncharacterized protein n=1 Tax=Naegleria lovaniensis TaxID=51637 RepID=A0AA88GU75_NAELO|nr:uncharacterized protein C9374_002680 [Naegleria lovaniensis]KAG2386234.1 hypothetical protein C9374_002680 [Naegleria lovaniensis]
MSSQAAKQIKEHARIIKDYIAKQDYKEALSELKKAIKLDPTNFNMFLYVGYCLGKLYASEHLDEQFVQAEQAYEKATTLQKDSEQPLMGLSELYEQKQQYQREQDQALKKKHLNVYEKLNQILKSKDDEKWYNNLLKYYKLFGQYVRSTSENDLSQCIAKFEGLVHTMIGLLGKKDSSSDRFSNYSYMLDLLFIDQYNEKKQIDILLDKRIQEQIDELKDKQKKKLLKEKKKLSEKELEKLLPSDLELLPLNKREELRSSWRDESTQQYLAQNMETDVDKMLQEILTFCKEKDIYCDFHVFDMIINRSHQRLKLIEDTTIAKKIKQSLVSVCKEALKMHKNYFKAMEQLFLINEEDDYQIFDENYAEKPLTKRMLHLFPYEGLSYIKLYNLLVNENIKIDKIEDELMVLLQRGLALIPYFIQGWIFQTELYLQLEKYKNASEIARKGLAIIQERELTTRASLKKLTIKLKVLQAISLQKLGSLNDAEQIFNEILGVDPNHLETIKGIADIEYQRGNLAKSREYYVKAIQINPKDDLTLCQTGWFCYLDKDFEAAIQYIKSAIEVNPNNYLIYYQHIEKDEDRCIKCYKKAVSLNPLEEEAGANLGDIYIGKGLLTLAASLFKDATSRNNRAGWAWSKLGFYQQSQNLLDQSIHSFQHALRVSPQDALCWEGLGESYKREGKYLAALKAFSRAIEINPTLVFSLVQSAYIKFQLSEFDNSREIYENVISIDEKYSVAYQGISDVLFKVSKTLYADGLFTQCAHQLIKAQCILLYGISKGFGSIMRSIWKSLGDIQTFMNLLPEKNIIEAILSYKDTFKGEDKIYTKNFNSNLSTKLDYLQEASKSYEKYLSFDQSDSDPWYDLAVSKLNQIFNIISSGKVQSIDDLTSQALEHVKKAISLNSTNSSYWNLLGILSDNHVVRQHCFIRAVQIDTKNYDAWNNLGALYLTNSNLKLARKAFLKAQAIYPESTVAWVGLALINENVPNREGIFRAKEDFKHATTLENIAPSYIGLAYTSLLTNDPIEAVQAIMKHFQFSSSDYAAWNVLGVALEMQQHFEKSLEAYNKCEGLLLDHQIKSKNNAQDLQQKGYLQNTKSVAFDEANLYSIENMLYLTRINKARILCKLQRFNEASSVFELCRKYSSEDMGIVMGSAVTSCFASDFSFSIKSISSAIENIIKKIKSGEPLEKRLIEMYNLLGRVYYQQKDHKKAKEIFEKCMKEFPDHFEAYHSLASLCVVMESKNPEPALNVIRQLKSRQVGVNLETVKLESIIYASYGEYEKARNAICRVIYLHPYEPKLWDLLSQTTLEYQFVSSSLDQKKKTKKSKSKFEVSEIPTSSTNSGAISQLTTQLMESSISRLATEIFPEDKLAVIDRLINIASMYYAMGSAPYYHNALVTLKHALSMTQKAMMLDPSNPKILRLLASCTHTMSILKKEKSINKVASSLLRGYLSIYENTSSDSEIAIHVASLEQLIHQGEYTKCMSEVKKLMERFKDVSKVEATLFSLLGKCILAKGENPSNLYGWFTLSELFINQRKYNMAKYCLDCCLVISKQTNDLNSQFVANAKLCYICLMMCVSDTKTDSTSIAKSGIEYAKNAFTINNESASLYLMYGKLQYILGNLDEAGNAFQQAMKLDPDQPLSRLNMYWVYYAKEDWGPAEEVLFAEKPFMSTESELFFTLSSFAFESGIPDAALKMIQKAIRLDPSNTKYWDYLHQIQESLKPKEPVKPSGSSKKK